MVFRFLYWVPRVYLIVVLALYSFLIFVNWGPVDISINDNSSLGVFISGIMSHSEKGILLAGVLLIATVKATTETIKIWKYISAVTLIILVIPFILGYIHDLNSPSVPFDTWGLGFIPLYLFGIPFMFFSFAKLIYEERRAKRGAEQAQMVK